jgi:hypothetical protein
LRRETSGVTKDAEQPLLGSQCFEALAKPRIFRHPLSTINFRGREDEGARLAGKERHPVRNSAGPEDRTTARRHH